MKLPLRRDVRHGEKAGARLACLGLVRLSTI